jgi:hypothetical protein
VRLIADDVVTPGGDDVPVGREDTVMTAFLDRRPNSLHLCDGFGVLSLGGRLKERILE